LIAFRNVQGPARLLNLWVLIYSTYQFGTSLSTIRVDVGTLKSSRGSNCTHSKYLFMAT
jgi:hypothetical protein